jgi:hypothetical protein
LILRLPVAKLARMIPEDIDLEVVVQDLRAALKPGEPLGYLRGKALMRDILVQQKSCSELEAEELVDTLEMQGFLHFLGDPSERSVADSQWQLETPRKG